MNSQIRDEIICSICLGSMKKPVIMLPCGHNLCKVCLDKLPGDPNKSCPTCRKSFKPEGLPRNRALENVIEKLDLPSGEDIPVTDRVQQLRVKTQRCNSFEIEQMRELAEARMRIKLFAEAKPILENILCDVTAVERFKATLQIAECAIGMNDTEEAKEICGDIVATAPSIRPKPFDCDVIIGQIKGLVEALAEGESRTALNLVRCGANLCRHFGANVKVVNLAFMASVAEEVTASMGSKHNEIEHYVIPLLEGIRYDVTTTVDADRVNRCEKEAWCLKHIGHCCIIIGDYEKSVEVNKEATSLVLNEIGDDACLYKVYGMCYTNMGTAYKNLKQYEDAINCYLKAIEINARANDWKNDDEKYENILTSSKGLTEVIQAIQSG